MPKNFTLEEVEASSMVVSIVDVAGNPDLILFKATAQGGDKKHECLVTRESVPLQCQLTGLQSATRYTISVRSCLSGDRCGDALTMEVDTKPQGRFEYNFH